MLRPPLIWKLLGVYLTLLLLSALWIDSTLRGIAREGAIVEHERSLGYTAELLVDVARPALGAPEGDPLRQALARRLAELSDAGRVRLTVVAGDGRVVADTDEDPARMDNHLGRPEVAEALEQGRGRALRFSKTLGRRILYVALPVREGDQPIGVARAAVSLTDLEAGLRELSWVVWGGALLAALFGLAAGWWSARRLGLSLDRMAHAAEDIARGRYDAARPYAASPELGRLAVALDAMAADLRGRMHAIEGDRNKVLAILASMVEGVIAVDSEERVVHMNAVAGRLLRVSPASAEGRRIWEVSRVIEVSEILEAARKRDRELSGEVRLAPVGSAATGGRLIELRASPLRGAGDETVGAVVVLHDVTELRRLEAVRRDFVANVSHELKTPLTAIRGLVETLLDDDEMDPGTRSSFLERMRDQAGRLSSLVSDLLTLARVESQEELAERVPVDLRDPLRQCAARFGPACERKRLELDLQLPDGPVEVLADEESLRQILDNLTDNAVKYTPAGGRVDLSLVTRGEHAQIEVRDTGIGIEPRDSERVFERFYRVDKARSREMGSTGLGLSIVKHLILALDGEVELESTPGAGSVFRVRLPLRCHPGGP
jgi:two-component system phosphate regulon sensor histidine kinase PhoR